MFLQGKWRFVRWFLWCSLVLLNGWSRPVSAQSLQRIGHLEFAPRRLMGCRHYVDSTGKEWAVLGTNLGLSVVEVSDPALPKERFRIDWEDSYHELSIWKGFAYVGSGNPGAGIAIVNLTRLPDTLDWKIWRGNGIYEGKVTTSHTVQTAGGFLYLFGGGTLTDGAVIADLSDPWNPAVAGLYTQEYVHDGFIRGDTMWTCEINKGWVAAIDISDKMQPAILTTQPTPGAYTHNAEWSADGNTLFTTDERPGAALCSFDVSDLDDIRLLDTYLPSRKPQGEVHNVRRKGDFLINPGYRGQLSIVDASQPDNLIEIAIDTIGNALIWDADPYLPSGIILATATLDGLVVYAAPEYRPACRLEGRIRNGVTGAPLNQAKVFVQGTVFADTSRNNGVYKTGTALPGAYTILVVKAGFDTLQVPDVLLQTGQTALFDFTLFPSSRTVSPENVCAAYPNPFSGDVYVRGMAGEALVSLYHSAGGLLFQQKVDSGGEIHLEGLESLPKGAYRLLLQSQTLCWSITLFK